MNETKIKTIIKNGENIAVEFKECRSAISKTCYETICAFLNRHGGELLLGVKDNGEVTGIDEQYVGRIKKDFTNAINNPQKLNPPFYLGIEDVKVDNKTILYVYVSESSQVHRCNGKIFDRNEDGDYDITNNTNLVSSLYLRKQTSYSENRVYPYVEMSDFRTDLIQQSRKIATIRRNDHPWSKMTDEELIKSSRLFQRDY
jgi:ATP-dependent DNA helicase RecG